MVRIALGALSSIGLVISLYFTLVYYRVIASDPRFLPRFCRLNEGSCRTILDAPQAKLFGLPNALVGLFYYALLLLFALNVWVEVPMASARWLFAASLFASVVGLTLAEALIRTLKTPCVLCFTTHGINIAISLLLYINL
jgi:uncharacterized membrane protein